MSRVRWTLPLLRRCAKRWSDGESWNQIGADLDATGDAVAHAVDYHRIPRCREGRAHLNAQRISMLERAQRMKSKTGAPWWRVAVQVEWPGSFQSLKVACNRRAREQA